jgi:hypothetical protein
METQWARALKKPAEQFNQKKYNMALHQIEHQQLSLSSLVE